MKRPCSLAPVIYPTNQHLFSLMDPQSPGSTFRSSKLCCQVAPNDHPFVRKQLHTLNCVTHVRMPFEAIFSTSKLTRSRPCVSTAQTSTLWIHKPTATRDRRQGGLHGTNTYSTSSHTHSATSSRSYWSCRHRFRKDRGFPAPASGLHFRATAPERVHEERWTLCSHHGANARTGPADRDRGSEVCNTAGLYSSEHRWRSRYRGASL